LWLGNAQGQVIRPKFAKIASPPPIVYIHPTDVPTPHTPIKLRFHRLNKYTDFVYPPFFRICAPFGLDGLSSNFQVSWCGSIGVSQPLHSFFFSYCFTLLYSYIYRQRLRFILTTVHKLIHNEIRKFYSRRYRSNTSISISCCMVSFFQCFA
jgi:hypothetical protein